MKFIIAEELTDQEIIEEYNYWLEVSQDLLSKEKEILTDEFASEYAEKIIDEKIEKIKQAKSFEEVSDIYGFTSVDNAYDEYEDETNNKPEDLEDFKNFYIERIETDNEEFEYLKEEYKIKDKGSEAEIYILNHLDEYPKIKEAFDKVDYYENTADNIQEKPYEEVDNMVRQIAEKLGYKCSNTKESKSSYSRYITLFKDDKQYKIRIADHKDVSMFGPRNSDITLDINNSLEDNKNRLEDLLLSGVK